MKCPKCGYMRQSRDDAFVPATECPSCGIVYSKHDTIAAPIGSALGVPKPPNLRPSAVDPESLKRARDRVEKRLRQKMETRIRDDRHEQTLELAKKITNESVRDSQDLFPPIMEEKPLKQETATESEQKEDPLLLEEMVGVQIHSGQSDTTADAEASEEGMDDLHAVEPQDEAPEVSEAAEPEDVASAEQEEVSDGMEAEAETEVVAETADEHTYPDDVQVETVLLTSQLDTNDLPIEEEKRLESLAADESPESEDENLPEAYIAAATTATSFGAKLTRLLPMVAWLILITGLVGSVLSWTTITDVEAGVNVQVSDSSSTLFPLGLLLGFAYLATGALGFAFFWVSSMINRQLKDIRHMLALHSNALDTEGFQD